MRIESLQGRSIEEIARYNSNNVDDMIFIQLNVREYEENRNLFKSVIRQWFASEIQVEGRLEQVREEIQSGIDFCFWYDGEELYFES